MSVPLRRLLANRGGAMGLSVDAYPQSSLRDMFSHPLQVVRKKRKQ
jgi:hypothetical protein